MLGRMYFAVDDGYQNFFLTKIKPYDTNLASTMTNLANRRVSLKFNNSVLVKKILLHCYSRIQYSRFIV